MSDSALKIAVRTLAARSSLSREAIADAFRVIMRGEGTDAQVAALLMALRVKGETSEEIAGVVEALREVMVVLPASEADNLVDTCGTGGGAIGTFNISTAAAFLAAGAGVRIAKHGNRSFTSKSGSADVLEALSVPIEISVEQMAKALESAGIVFMFAPLMHPALRHVGPIRRELAIPTVMNIVGPLANPARAGRQVVGVAEAARLQLLAEALARLGAVRAMVVHGELGLDEISPVGRTQVVEVRGGQLSSWMIDPADYGFADYEISGLAGGTPAANAQIIEDVLKGGGGGGDNGGRGVDVARAAVLLNAAAAILVADAANDYAGALEIAKRALHEGRGYAALQKLKSALGS